MNAVRWEYEKDGWHMLKEVAVSNQMNLSKLVDNDDEMNALDLAFLRGYVSHRYHPFVTGR